MDIERRSLASLVEEVKAEAAAAEPGTPSPYRRLIAFPSLLKNVAATSLLNSLATVDEERTKLLTRRTTADPDVAMLTSREQQIEEHVDVDVSGTAWFERAVSKRDGAPDRVRDPSLVEPIVDGQQLIAKLAH